MTIQKDYETHLARLNGSLEGKSLLVAAPKAAKALYELLTRIGEEHSVIWTALTLMEQPAFLDLIEKNLILIMGRVLALARSFDALDPQKKVEKLVGLLGVVREEQRNWLADYEKKAEPLHDKVARKKRRKELLLQETLFQTKDKPFCEEWVRVLMQLVLPEGANSLFLPSMARFFLSENFLESTLLKNIDFVMKSVHAREWKETFLYHMIASMFKDVFLAKSLPVPSWESVPIPDALFEKAKEIVSWILDLASMADPVLPFLSKEESTRKACECAMGFVQSFSLEQVLMKLVQLGLSQKFFPGNLDTLVDAVSGDSKAIAFLIKKVGSLFLLQDKLALNPTIGSLLAMGVKGAVIESAIKDKADVLVYNEIPLKIFQHFRLFVLSPFFDRVIYRTITL